MAEHHERHLPVPGGRGRRSRRSRSRASTVPNRSVPSSPSGLDARNQAGLALEEQQREVVRRRIRQRDRGRASARRRRRACWWTAGRPCCERPPRQARRGRTRAPPRSAAPRGTRPRALARAIARGRLKKDVMSGATLVQTGASEAPSNVIDPIITARSATVPGAGSSCASPDSGRRRPQPVSPASDRRDAREEVEVDAERLAPSATTRLRRTAPSPRR